MKTTRRSSRLTSSRHAGFTLPEILIVIVMISVLALVAIPRFATANGRRHMESARMRIAAGLATARQGAIQKGEPVMLKIVKNRVTVVRAAPGSSNLISPVPLDTLYKIRAETTPADSFSVSFSSRGFATNLGTGITVIRLTRTIGGLKDSVMITSTGMVKR